MSVINTASVHKLDTYLTLKEVMAVTKVGSSTIYRWVKEGTFPDSRKLGANCVRWTEADIKAWQQGLPFTNALKKASEARAARSKMR